MSHRTAAAGMGRRLAVQSQARPYPAKIAPKNRPRLSIVGPADSAPGIEALPSTTWTSPIATHAYPIVRTSPRSTLALVMSTTPVN